MGGFFGVASKRDCVWDLFFGTDYHSHLGTRRAGMTVFGEKGFDRAIHNITNSPFRTKFDRDVNELKGNLGIGCISDYEPQPLLIRSHLGTFAITTVGRIDNLEELVEEAARLINASGLERNVVTNCSRSFSISWETRGDIHEELFGGLDITQPEQYLNTP